MQFYNNNSALNIAPNTNEASKCFTEDKNLKLHLKKYNLKNTSKNIIYNTTVKNKIKKGYQTNKLLKVS